MELTYARPDGWVSRGACQRADPDLFFPVTDQGPAAAQVAAAKDVCRRCPVQPECLEFALISGQRFGVWGGASEQERSRMRRNRLRRRHNRTRPAA
jgi:WhiB family transcriptional regulator, redox-sensing transcriptional regulator